MTDLNRKITLTALELKIIMEDAFIDGYSSGTAGEWYTEEAALEDSETGEAVRNLVEEYK